MNACSCPRSSVSQNYKSLKQRVSAQDPGTRTTMAQMKKDFQRVLNDDNEFKDAITHPHVRPRAH